ncbi:MAG: hypothetical protein OMM_00548 [Candidatus Magnetoglobus multicellularis str. Araruama]|uniref:Uncharacterized protein n=1 Tax=Candidatus Magnetoglobus multicellularis str. Araruama TaxID=890399 RepID=A0A1V1PGN8_9BACT|nr:MAG: hypothetical protein OMM_00548 [Candidatus Magnetoglobus multicellularis str. Araruama]
MNNLTEQQYRELERVNYSSLADFSKSPDHCLVEKEHKGFFEIGHIFELMLKYQCLNNSYKKLYDEYFICEGGQPVPDKIYEAIHKKEDLTSLIVKNKDGSRSKRYNTLHTYIDLCLSNIDKMPISDVQFNVLKKMVKNTCKMVYKDKPLTYYLKNSSWGVPVIWTETMTTQSGGLVDVPKKALIDALFKVNEIEYIVFDIKTTHDSYLFNKMIYDKYWIQDMHYKQAIKQTTNAISVTFVFIVASKSKPYISQSYSIQYETDDKWQQYNDLCINYYDWFASGKNEVGVLDHKTIKMR